MIRRIESGISAKALGFDYLSWVEGFATQLNLKGTVFTKHDGSVKIIAEGEEEDLTKFASKLEKGDFLFPGENFYLNWDQASGEFNDFSISHQE